MLSYNMRFNDENTLDPGIHEMEWDDFYAFFSFSPKRKELLEGLEKVIPILWEVGCSAIYINGSFVTNKLEPGDWDACFDCDSIKIVNDLLNAYPLFDRKKQKELYKGELFYAQSIADEFGNIFLDFFQQIRYSNKKKGIVKINLYNI